MRLNRLNKDSPGASKNEIKLEIYIPENDTRISDPPTPQNMEMETNSMSRNNSYHKELHSFDNSNTSSKKAITKNFSFGKIKQE